MKKYLLLIIITLLFSLVFAESINVKTIKDLASNQ